MIRFQHRNGGEGRSHSDHSNVLLFTYPSSRPSDSGFSFPPHQLYLHTRWLIFLFLKGQARCSVSPMHTKCRWRTRPRRRERSLHKYSPKSHRSHAWGPWLLINQPTLTPPHSPRPILHCGSAGNCCSGSFVFLQITKASRKRLTVNLAYSENHQIRVSQQDFRLFRTLFLLMISFFIMWSPIIITILLILIQNFKRDLVISPSLFFWVVAFTFANSALNPILYNMSLFRNEWRKMFRRCFFLEKGAMFTDTSLRRNDLSIISS